MKLHPPLAGRDPGTFSNPRRRRLLVIAAALLTAVSLLFSACSSAGTSTSSSASSGPALSGDPVRVMTIQPVNTSLPSYPAGLKAATIYSQWINDHGGIKGRPLEVITCDDRGDPNITADCARQAVSANAVAVVGSFSWDAGRAIGILEQAGVPWFGACCPVVQQELTSPDSFVTGSLFSFPAAMAWRAARDGCKKPAAVQLDVAIKDLNFDQMRAGFKAAGFDPDQATYIALPAQPGDFSSQVAEATNGTDCIIGSIAEDSWAAFLPAFQSAGATQRLYGIQGQLNQKIASQFPDATQNAVVVNAFPNIDGPMWNDYRGALKQYGADDDLDWNSLVSLGAWASLDAFTKIASDLPQVTAKDFSAALATTKYTDPAGKLPPLDFTTPYTGLGGAYPRLFDRSVLFDVITDGTPRATDGVFYDMSNVMEGKAP